MTEDASARIECAICLAADVLGDRESAHVWMSTAQLQLAGRTPLEVATTGTGAGLVANLLLAMGRREGRLI